MRIVSILRSTRLIKATAIAAVVTLCGADMLQDAVANGDTRTLSFHHVHSGASATVTFKRNGRYDPAALQQLNVLMQDWRRKEPTKMDPALFDIMWEVYRDVGATQPIQVIGGYRSPQTNAMLRSRSRGVARMSQHMLGKAMDFYIPGVPLAKVREAGLRLQRGGVGFYPTSGSPFVHLDTGGIRHWPRMTRTQLAKVFPNGKTVHIPSDGKPMPGYAQALAEVESHGDRPGGAGAAFASAATTAEPKKNIFAALFNKNDDKDSGDEETSASASDDEEAPAAVAAASPAAATSPAPNAVAAANVPAPPQSPLPRSPEAIAALAAAGGPAMPAVVPRPMARPNEAPPRLNATTVAVVADAPAASAALAAESPAVPRPLTRPVAPPIVVASADPVAAAPIAGTVPSPRQSQGRNLPTVIVGDARSATAGPTLAYASVGEFIVARPASGSADARPAPKATARGTAASHSPAAQAQIRRLFSGPTVASDTTLRPPELRRFAAFVAPPHQVVDTGFGRDASNGLDTARFSGAAVVAIPVVAHVPVEAAPTLPKRKRLSMAGSGTLDGLLQAE